MIATQSTYDRARVPNLHWIREPKNGPEEAVVRLWQKADSLTTGLVTLEGSRLNVLYPGRRSSSAGPDFRDCILIDESGEVIVGDVEVHVSARDWSAHGHHVDPNYNGVVLHVVLRAKGAYTTTLESHTKIPAAALEPVAATLETNRTSPSPAQSDVAISDIHKRLDIAGDARFRSKAGGFAIEIEGQDPEQVLYTGVMEALGYSSNRKPFAALAKTVPIGRLNTLRDEPAATRLLAIRALLISAAGLMSSVSTEDTQTLRGVLRYLPPVKKITEPWKSFRVRPSNHPIRRIEGVAVLINRSIDTGLLVGLHETVRNGDNEAVRQWLEVPPFIGTSRARDVAVNVVLPLMYAWGGITRNRELRTRSLQMFRKAPSLADNEITREMLRLLPDGVGSRGARRQQGLIHLYKNMSGLRTEGQKSKT